jgi:glycerol-3-phosphate dehydrogenase
VPASLLSLFSETTPEGAAADVDVLVVGGGVNGTGIARDLAGRGWRVALSEQDDLAAHTSSASTKLIHGGLRYLEHHEFGLVRRALREREVLLRSAPHIIRAMRFVMPHDPSMRPAWLIRLGLFLYDHLAQRRHLQGSHGIQLRRHPAGEPLKPQFHQGFVYSDGWVDDARLVVLNAVDARTRGAQVHTRTRVTSARRSADVWEAVLQGAAGPQTLRARALVNAAGPWAGSFLRDQARMPAAPANARSLRLVKGSHIVVARCFEHDHAYLFQSPDQRVVFAIPYEDRYTLIGTTDVEFQGDPASVAIDAAETAYLCEQASRYFRAPVRESDVVWSYSGVRPLLDDASPNASAVTRDYVLDADAEAAPLLTVWGGKMTTARKLAEEAAGQIGRMLGSERAPWTERAPLPGGDFSGWIGKAQRPDTDFERMVAAVRRRYGWLAPAAARRLTRAYGSRVDRVLHASARAMGAEVAPGLTEAELHYLCREEWACTADDVLWRRSKLGLHYTPAERARVAAWMDANQSQWREAA